LATLSVDGARLLADLAELARHGRSDAGWTRPALTPSDAAARRYLIGRMEAAGLSVRHDEVGNLRARRPGRDAGAAAVLTGSHLDSVPSGGHLDGPLGVVGALAAVEALDAAGVSTERPIEVVIFVGEEGSRFPRGTIGSAAVAGHLSVDEVLALRDADGVSYREALATYGDRGEPLPARAAPGSVHAFVELHIEQGGVLEQLGADVGAVTAIAGLVQRSITFLGDANHAGTTPMELRRDALLAAAEWALGVERITHGLGGGVVATVGRLEVYPGGKNIIPGRVEAICDLRAPDRAHLDALDATVVSGLQVTAWRHVATQHRLLQRVEPGPMDERVIAAVERGAAAAGLRSHRMHSGAIHDALHMAELCPASMIFVPSQGGRSHCPEEASRPEHLVNGATVLAHALADLAGAR
jgi:allantoate deiminase